MKNTALIIGMAAVLLFFTSPATARTKLSALPGRGDTVIRLSKNKATLVEEERVLTLQKGLNQVDFSWKGVRIDPDSIRLTMLSHPDQVVLFNVSYPPGEAALVWEISSAAAFQEKVRVCYLLDGIDNLWAYTAMTDADEKTFMLKGYMVVRNFSGEDFSMAALTPETGTPAALSTLNGETRRVLAIDVADVPVEKIWRFDAATMPWDPDKVDKAVGIPVSYRLKNVEQAGLGKFAFGSGKTRLFQADGKGGWIFLGEDRLPDLPVGDETDLRMGDSRDIVVTQKKLESIRKNVRRNRKNKVVLFDLEETISAEIRNFKKKPAVLTMIQHIDGHWEMKSVNMDYELKDAFTLEFEIRLAPGEKKELNMTYVKKNLR